MRKTESDAEWRERQRELSRPVVEQSGKSDLEVNLWLRESLKDAPDWLLALVLSGFGYNINRPPDFPPIGRMRKVYR